MLSDRASGWRSKLASPIDIPVYSDALVVLGTAGIVVPLLTRLGVSPVLGYLMAGAVLGPLGLGSFIEQAPLLYWLTVVDATNVAGIANLGVVFLLFLIGLELSYERLMAMRRLVFGLGMLQVVTTTTLLAVLIGLTGISGPVAVVVGACLALSSTAIVLEVLSRQERLTTSTGRTSFAVLLAQDLAVVVLLLLISVLGADKGSSVLATVGMALAQAGVAIAVIALVGRAFLRPLFRLVAGTGSSELFVAAILFVIVATGLIAAVAQLSMALGAFVAGLLLAETEFRKAIEATIEPFKGLLLGVFFFTVGMGIDARELLREPLMLLGAVVVLIAVKALVLIGLARLYRVPWPAAVETGLLLGPGGEFAFVGIGLALTLGVVPAPVASFTLAVTSLTMVLIPVLAALARRLRPMLEAPVPADPILALGPEKRARHAIVVGQGRVGTLVCKMLQQHGVGYTGVDRHARTVIDARGSGLAAFYGDATSQDFLKACGIQDAAGVIITVNNRKLIDDVVAAVRELRPSVLIVSRARDADHARHLYAMGVTDVVPETIEASLQLSEAALVGLGIPTGKVIASVHEERDTFRRALQEAAKAAGVSKDLRARTSRST
jgi:CPA2 family monovalent cation:H+ antiporter-2